MTAKGRVQIRFADGAYVSVHPDTTLRVDEYSYAVGQADEARSIMSLLRGGLRTVTGLIGRRRMEAWKLETPVASIGIRGTAGAIEHDVELESTTVRGAAGVFELCSTVCAEVGPGQTGRVVGSGNPTVIATVADTGAGGGVTTASSDAPVAQCASTGARDACSPASSLPSTEELLAAAGDDDVFVGDGIGRTMAVTAGQDVAGAAGAEFATGLLVSSALTPNLMNADPVAMAFDDAWRVSAFRTADGLTVRAAQPGRMLEPAEVDGVLGWGRITGSVRINDTSGRNYFPVNAYDFDQSSGLHIVYGVPTPSAQMPRGSADYNFLGATTPTMDGVAAQVGDGVRGASLSANFDTHSVSLEMALTSAGINYEMNTGESGLTIGRERGALVQPSSFVGQGAWTTASGGGAVAGGANDRGSSPCASACSTTVRGFFAGAQASHAGVTYGIDASSGKIRGAAAFVRAPSDSSGPRPLPPVITVP